MSSIKVEKKFSAGERLSAPEEARISIKLIIQLNSIQFNACLFTRCLNSPRPNIKPVRAGEYITGENRKQGLQQEADIN